MTADGAVLSGMTGGVAVTKPPDEASAVAVGHALFMRHRREVNRLVYQLLGPDVDTTTSFKMYSSG